jgi:hypothetical protein
VGLFGSLIMAFPSAHYVWPLSRALSSRAQLQAYVIHRGYHRDKCHGAAQSWQQGSCLAICAGCHHEYSSGPVVGQRRHEGAARDDRSIRVAADRPPIRTGLRVIAALTFVMLVGLGCRSRHFPTLVTQPPRRLGARSKKAKLGKWIFTASVSGAVPGNASDSGANFGWWVSAHGCLCARCGLGFWPLIRNAPLGFATHLPHRGTACHEAAEKQASFISQRQKPPPEDKLFHFKLPFMVDDDRAIWHQAPID